jgi:hypothetical protein
MKYRIIKLKQLSGKKATFYTAILEGEEKSLFERFLEENQNNFPDELIDIVDRLGVMANHVGAIKPFFKENEGRFGDLVCALYDSPKANLRLYCLRLGNAVIILGGGGHKPKAIRAFQEDDKLSKENSLMRLISKLLYQKMKEGEIFWLNDLELGGDLTLGTDE